MKKVTLFLLILILAGFASPYAFAASPWTEKGTWSQKAGAKLDFGIKNLFGGPFELIRQPWAAYKAKTNVGAALGHGIYYAIADTLGGALHIITFPIVELDIPLPENGVSF